MNPTRIRELTLELNLLSIQREQSESARRQREKEILGELVRLTTLETCLLDGIAVQGQ